VRRSTTAAVLAGALASLLAAAATTASSATSATNAGTTTLTVWTYPNDTPATRALYTRFEKKFHVKLKLVVLPTVSTELAVQTKWNSGARPDILEYQPTSLFWSLNPTKNLVDLSKLPFVKASGSLAKVSGSYNGHTYAAQVADPTVFGAFYNKAVFARNGLTAPKTYPDLMHICTVLKAKDPDVAPIYESGHDQWPLQILGGLTYLAQYEKSLESGYEEQVLTKQAKLSDPNGPLVKALRAYKNLQDNNCFNSDVQTATVQDGQNAIVAGKAAMQFLPSDFLPLLAQQVGGVKKLDSVLGWATPSATSAVAPWAGGPKGTWFVPKTGDAKKQAIALQFIKWVTGPGYQQYLNESGNYPIISTGKQAPGASELQQAIARSYKTGTLAFNTNLVGFNSQFAILMSKLIAGQATPAQIGQQAQLFFAQAAHGAHLKGW
jgi:raffinose/stachyose/melibiose transport system substrate-binding protein